MAVVEDRVCVLVVSHNHRELTDSLCNQIVANTKRVKYDLHVVETGSNLAKCSTYMTCWVRDKVRMTRGWNILRNYADRLAATYNRRYAAYQLFVNDARWVDDCDMISTLYEELLATPAGGQIHPYQTHIRDAGRLLRKQRPSGIREVSFTEIVCPMIRGEAWRQNPRLLDDGFFYGWGLDYDMPYQLSQEGWRTYVSDTVGITHHAGTTYHDAKITEERLRYDQFQAAARDNMYEVMRRKYGDAWPTYLLDAVPESVDPQALYDWLVNSEPAYEKAIRAWSRK